MRTIVHVPAAQDRGLDFATVGTVQLRRGKRAVGGIDDAPGGPRRNGSDQPPLVGVGVDQQQRSGRGGLGSGTALVMDGRYIASWQKGLSNGETGSSAGGT